MLPVSPIIGGSTRGMGSAIELGMLKGAMLRRRDVFQAITEALRHRVHESRKGLYLTERGVAAVTEADMTGSGELRGSERGSDPGVMGANIAHLGHGGL